MARAASDDSDDEFSQALDCPIHMSVLKQPKALPCQHTFCRGCLLPLVHNNQITCPLCREVCQLTAKGIDGLRNNITVQNILDALCPSCQKRHKETTCLCCQQHLCHQCRTQHSSELQAKITGKKQELRNMAQALRKISQGLGQNKTLFLSQAAKVKSEVKVITKVIEQLQKKQAQLEAELNSLIESETTRINQCRENIKQQVQEIQAALQRPERADTAILENLERLSENITALFSTMAVSPATVSCEMDEQLVQDVCMGLGPIEYTPSQPGAPTDLLQDQPVTIDYQAISTPRKMFGQRGSSPRQFNGPSHVAISPVSGNLVICDTDNSRLQVFTADGKFIRMFGSKRESTFLGMFWSKSIGDGQFDFGNYVNSGGVTVTDGGEIVVADTFNHRLQVFDEAGEFVRVIGSKGSAPGKFSYPRGVTCDNSDYLYICDCGNHRVQVMTMVGSVVRVIAASDVPGGDWDPVDIAVCPDGDLVVADLCTGSTGLHVLSAKGQQHKATIACGEGQYVECLFPIGVAVDPEGHILVTDGYPSGTHRVYVVERNGKLVCSFGGKGRSRGKFERPVGVAVTQDGGIIVIDHRNHRVQIF